jgi:hypothetical protein
MVFMIFLGADMMNARWRSPQMPAALAQMGGHAAGAAAGHRRRHPAAATWCWAA